MIKLISFGKLLSILNSFGVKYIYKNLNEIDIYKFIAPVCQFWAGVAPVPVSEYQFSDVTTNNGSHNSLTFRDAFAVKYSWIKSWEFFGYFKETYQTFGKKMEIYGTIRGIIRIDF